MAEAPEHTGSNGRGRRPPRHQRGSKAHVKAADATAVTHQHSLDHQGGVAAEFQGVPAVESFVQDSFASTTKTIDEAAVPQSDAAPQQLAPTSQEADDSTSQLPVVGNVTIEPLSGLARQEDEQQAKVATSRPSRGGGAAAFACVTPGGGGASTASLSGVDLAAHHGVNGGFRTRITPVVQGSEEWHRVTRGCVHWEHLFAKIPFVAFPPPAMMAWQVEQVFASCPHVRSNPPDGRCCELFVGQMPFGLHRNHGEKLLWILNALFGVTVTYIDEIGHKEFKGCYHVRGTEEEFATLAAKANMRVLVDRTGVWLATTCAEEALLKQYTASLQNGVGIGLPKRPMVVEPRKGTKMQRKATTGATAAAAATMDAEPMKTRSDPPPAIDVTEGPKSAYRGGRGGGAGSNRYEGTTMQPQKGPRVTRVPPPPVYATQSVPLMRTYTAPGTTAAAAAAGAPRAADAAPPSPLLPSAHAVSSNIILLHQPERPSGPQPGPNFYDFSAQPDWAY